MADKRDKKKVTFKLHEPLAHEVFMAGRLRDGTETTKPLRKCKDGTWRTTLRLSPGVYEYRIIVSGTGRPEPGPTTRKAAKPGIFNCVVWV